MTSASQRVGEEPPAPSYGVAESYPDTAGKDGRSKMQVHSPIRLAERCSTFDQRDIAST